MGSSSRISRHATASTALSLLSDRQLAERLESADVVSEGIGGTGARLDVDGVPVFAKRVPLTALERRHPHSTANLYGLPAFCHYGLGSPEGSAWRELALHVMANGWVLSGQCENFPLLHHWRILPVPSGRVPDRPLEEDVEYWGGSDAVRRRLTELRDASSSVVLFCEYFPANVHRWLPGRLDQVERLASQIADTLSFLRAQGVLHFDNHFENFLTDGDRFVLTDFGLSFARRFDLTAQEVAFAELNAGHDRAYGSMYLVNWLVTEVCGTWDRESRLAAVRQAAAGELALPSPVAEVVARHAAVAVAMNDFYGRLLEDRETPFPATLFAG
ncbi:MULTISPECIES: serine/threonine-protein kinase [Amycolatopsis]|uniref:Serine/threonine protein kinase n=1 Tax=Amycolatopsis dendrobii TaxID=2760662 RepID=A0A7W3ZEY9_9PSEU|nr:MULTISPECIES: serine/threonine-protein kinase [Amycolatopsis]MBB1159071.1 serine/threonine protein kinase [Amycolatopsis dendrobii]UKD52688.1 serine/threonine-protein kinase [Amycolatopsis sp. FU40]